MQLRDHIGSTKTAVVLHPSATVVSFAELDARANQLAHFLRRVGLGAGDTVAILMENNRHVHTASLNPGAAPAVSARTFR